MVDNALEYLLNSVGFICTEIKGTSMNPLLFEGVNKVVIERPLNRLKKGDVALYKRDSGEYVLHRVMKVLNDSYVFCGDNHFVLEYGITDAHVLGVMKGYYKGEKYVNIEKSFKYKLYKLFWCNSLSFRKFLNYFRSGFNKIFKK